MRPDTTQSRNRNSLLRRSLQYAGRSLRTAIRLLRPGVTLLHGTEKQTGEPVHICYAGFSPLSIRIGFPSQILSGIDKEVFFGRRWLWQVGDIARKNDCAFLLVESPAKRKNIINRFIRSKTAQFFLPYYVMTHIRTDDLDALLHKNEHLQNDIRRLRIEGFQVEISRTPKDFRRFLEQYYLPYRDSHYGSRAMNFDYDFLCRENEVADRSWELLKVTANNDWIAGMIFQKRAGCADAMEVGVKEGDYQLVKRGALAAAYWFFVKRAYELGYSEASFMYTPAFLRNGVLQFKSKYRPKLSAAPSPAHGLLLMPLSNDSQTRQILLDQPFFEIHPDGLGLTAFARDAEDAEKAEETVRRELRRFREAPPIKIVLLEDALPPRETN